MTQTDKAQAAEQGDRPTKAGRRKSGYHHNDLRNAVLAEAADLIGKRNGPHFSLREIAAALGVTHSSVYRHFADKAALLDALTAKGFETLRAYQIAEAARYPEQANHQLIAFCVAYVRFAREQLGFFRLLFDNRPDGDSAGSGRTAFEAEAYTALIALIRRGQEEGYLIDGDPRRMAGYMVLAPHGLAHYLSQPNSPGTNPQGPIPLMPPEELGVLAAIPVMRNPPDRATIIARFFTDS